MVLPFEQISPHLLAAIAALGAAVVLAAGVRWYLSPGEALDGTTIPPMSLDGPSCIVIPRPGGYDQLQARKLGGVSPATQGATSGMEGVPPDQLVTVRVVAAGVNYADVCIRWGLYASWNKFGGGRRYNSGGDDSTAGRVSDIHNVPGFEFSGTVEAVGSGVDNFCVGDPVFGVSLFGCYSSRLVVPAHCCFKRPAKLLTATQAAALPVVAMTAYFAVERQAAPIAAGDLVLVHSAAGGVGSMLVQMCKIKGWRVCAVVGSAHKVDACKILGADCVVDKSATPHWWLEVERFAPAGFAAVFDANGVATLSQSWEHLAPCGKLIVYGFHTMLPKRGGVLGPVQWLGLARDWLRTPRFNPLDMTSSNRSVLAFNLSFLFDRRDIFETVRAPPPYQ